MSLSFEFSGQTIEQTNNLVGTMHSVVLVSTTTPHRRLFQPKVQLLVDDVPVFFNLIEFIEIICLFRRLRI